MNYQDFCTSIGVSTLEGYYFQGQSLIIADFSGGNLRCADFSESDLRGANFTGADLRGARFVSADLRNANFADTCVTVLGEDSRGYVFYTMPHIFIGAGCRMFLSVADAVSHWEDRHFGNKERREFIFSMIEKATIAKEQAKVVGGGMLSEYAVFNRLGSL